MRSVASDDVDQGRRSSYGESPMMRTTPFSFVALVALSCALTHCGSATGIDQPIVNSDGGSGSGSGGAAGGGATTTSNGTTVTSGAGGSMGTTVTTTGGAGAPGQAGAPGAGG